MERRSYASPPETREEASPPETRRGAAGLDELSPPETRAGALRDASPPETRAGVEGWGALAGFSADRPRRYEYAAANGHAARRLRTTAPVATPSAVREAHVHGELFGISTGRDGSEVEYSPPDTFAGVCGGPHLVVLDAYSPPDTRGSARHVPLTGIRQTSNARYRGEGGKSCYIFTRKACPRTCTYDL
jgi:hypothetical protein